MSSFGNFGLGAPAAQGFGVKPADKQVSFATNSFMPTPQTQPAPFSTSFSTGTTALSTNGPFSTAAAPGQTGLFPSAGAPGQTGAFPTATRPADQIDGTTIFNSIESAADKALIQELYSAFMVPMKQSLKELAAEKNVELDNLGTQVRGVRASPKLNTLP